MLKNIDFTTSAPIVNELAANESLQDDFEYLFVGNIPPRFRSSDLRYFFSEFVEKGAFKCFHYRHRPETQIVKSDSSSIQKENSGDDKTCCCVIKVFQQFVTHILTQFTGKEWRSKHLDFFQKHVHVKKLGFKSDFDPHKQFRTNKELREDIHNDNQDLHFEDFKDMLELNPPQNIMPYGNVGTPTKYFQNLIRECKMPSSVIKSLDLDFSVNKRDKIYSNVRMNYAVRDNKNYNTRPKDSDGEKLSGNDLIKNSHAQKNNEKEDGEVEEEEDREAEDWERYEALHDDVDNQARPKAVDKLFEEDLEVKWEKGGSGLVFYTDAFYWNQLKGTDFDEDTVDDWDVDYSVYYEDDAGDKASRDQLMMRMEKRRREGKQDGPMKYSDVRRKEKRNREKMTNNFAEFEKHSKGFGSRILKKQGWKEGSGVGSSREGISEPIEFEGDNKRTRIGLGYYGAKLDRTATCLKPKVAEREVYISTIYDDKDSEVLDAMRFHGQELLKYRPPAIKFSSSSNTISALTPSDSRSSKT